MKNKTENSENLSKVLILIAFAALVIAVIVLGTKTGKKLRNNAELKGTVPADSAMMMNLAGTYDVSFSSYDSLDASSAEILPIDDDQYELVTISKYGPRTYTLQIAGTTLHSDILGEGTVEYKKSVDKTTITFTKGGETCTFTR
jgi:hypothetical protein